MFYCPKCNAPVSNNRTDCPRCGIRFSKYNGSAGRQSAPVNRQPNNQPQMNRGVGGYTPPSGSMNGYPNNQSGGMNGYPNNQSGGMNGYPNNQSGGMNGYPNNQSGGMNGNPRNTGAVGYQMPSGYTNNNPYGNHNAAAQSNFYPGAVNVDSDHTLTDDSLPNGVTQVAAPAAPAKISTVGLLVLSIFALLMCTVPGIVALVNVTQINRCRTVEEQRRKIQASKIWSIVGIVIGLISVGVYCYIKLYR